MLGLCVSWAYGKPSNRGFDADLRALLGIKRLPYGRSVIQKMTRYWLNKVNGVCRLLLDT